MAPHLFAYPFAIPAYTPRARTLESELPARNRPANQRIIVALSRETPAILDSRFISRALLHYVDVCRKQNLRERVQREALLNAERGLVIAAEWSPVEEEAEGLTKSSLFGLIEFQGAVRVTSLGTAGSTSPPA